MLSGTLRSELNAAETHACTVHSEGGCLWKWSTVCVGRDVIDGLEVEQPVGEIGQPTVDGGASHGVSRGITAVGLDAF